MSALPPCSCGAPADRLLAASSYCDPCAEAFLEPIRGRVFSDEGGIGYGRQVGRMRPDWGPRFADLACSRCSATWTGPIGEPCSYCIRFVELAVDARREVLLRPDLPDDDRRPAALKRWAHDLADAVKAELITEHEARAAWGRKVVRDAA